jgi:hypothetical protein
MECAAPACFAPCVRGVGDAANKKSDTTSLWGLWGGVSDRSEEARRALVLHQAGMSPREQAGEPAPLAAEEPGLLPRAAVDRTPA